MSEPARDAEDDARADQSEAPSSDDPSSGLGPPTAVESLVGALLEAGPDVAEHVVKAAQELLLAVQVIVDAADRAVQEQQGARKEQTASDPQPSSSERDDSVRHLDLAE
jgi:hypothetical protein